MRCLDCLHFLQSRDAGQRAYIDDYGYCKSAPSRDERAMLFNGKCACWITPQRFTARPRTEAAQ